MISVNFRILDKTRGIRCVMRNLIRNILKEEVNRKYAKPSPKLEQLVYRWLNNYFDGAQMYHKKHYESTHSFEFCKKGKEILDLFLHLIKPDFQIPRKSTQKRVLRKEPDKNGVRSHIPIVNFDSLPIFAVHF